MSFARQLGQAPGQWSPLDVGWYFVYAKLPQGIWHPSGWSWGQKAACSTAMTIWPDVRVAVWGYTEQKWIYDGMGAGCH